MTVVCMSFLIVLLVVLLVGYWSLGLRLVVEAF
jgi:hypothetical protein